MDRACAPDETSSADHETGILNREASQAMRDWLVATLALRRVVPVGLERTIPGGGRLILTSAELWSNEVLVSWSVIAASRSDVDHLAAYRSHGDHLSLANFHSASPSLTDDVGTRYECQGISMNSAGLVQRNEARFSGPAPEEATTLWFSPTDLRAEVADQKVQPLEIRLR